MGYGSCRESDIPVKKCRENADNRIRERPFFKGEIFLGKTSVHIDCPICHARYHMDPALFDGAKGIRLRCRKCGNTLDVVNPVGIGPDRNAPNDPSVSRGSSGNRGNDPAVPLAGQDRPTPAAMESTLPAGEPARLSRVDGEDEESWVEVWRNTLPGLAEAYTPLPESPARASRYPLVVLFLFLLIVVGGSAYLIFTKLGKEMLSDIGRNLADTVRFFRS